ncbi:MAG TPA: diaminopimelate epimerase [Solirubrobacterales bacterium]|nr:diaminopimelate epimerase [Solirubrobacterales bacterium]
MRFTKMHGLGNDFILVDGFEEKLDEAALPEQARAWCDRHFGIGADGLIVVLPTRVAHFRWRIFNPDGSEPESCGNGIRCLAKFVYDRKMTAETTLTVETLGGVKTVMLDVAGGTVRSVRVDMGEPAFRRRLIPMRGPEEDEALNETVQADGAKLDVTCLSVGNPHCVTFVDDVDHFPVEKLGPQVENHSLFPRRTNVEFVQVLSRRALRVRTWERGAGETLACGSGACASVIAAARTGRADRRAAVRLLGGELQIDWAEDGHVHMTGPAVEVFTGEL